MKHSLKSRWVTFYGIALFLLTGCGGSVSPNTSNPVQPGCSTTTVSAPTARSQWTWMSGTNASYQSGIYGTLGTAAAYNVPGGRQNAVAWTDKCGALWLFGGYGEASNSSGGDLNDLWRYANNEWTWMAGSDLAEQFGVYGTQGVAYPPNIPSARDSAASWIDRSGNLWLFGGEMNEQYLNDLWEYQP